MFKSEIKYAGRIAFPPFTGIRVMMMPVRLEDPESVPFSQWRDAFSNLVARAPVQKGVGYLTIDEAEVRAGETHRRPGLHVDGIGPDGRAAAWGGGGGYAANGMLVASDVLGCVGFRGTFEGWPGANGDCAHLRDQLPSQELVVMCAGDVYRCSPMAVHTATPMSRSRTRTFVRLSMPNDCPWYEGYSKNPLGVEPTGPIHPRREAFMAYRP